MAEYREVSRTNCEGGTAVFNYAVCQPHWLDIAWSDTAKKFSDLMAGYPGSWQRASNSNYLNTTTGEPLGYVMKNHRILHTAATTTEKRYDGWWISDQLYNAFVDPGTGDFYTSVALDRCWLGLNVGPLLVIGGAKTNLATQINEPPYTGLYPTSATRNGEPILRVGFGWCPNFNLIVHVFCRAGGCSLYDLQNFFMEFPGISAALAFDGGSSAGMIDKEIGSTVIGYNTRLMKTAFVIVEKDPIPAGFPA